MSLHHVTQDVDYAIIPPVVNQNYGGNMIAFFTAKVDAIVPGSLEDHLSQVVPQLVACAKHLRYMTIYTCSMPLTFCV